MRKLRPARTPGPMIGARYVHEFNPRYNTTRGWVETLDKNFNVRQVRPQLSATSKEHYLFEVNGKLKKTW